MAPEFDFSCRLKPRFASCITFVNLSKQRSLPQFNYCHYSIARQEYLSVNKHHIYSIAPSVTKLNVCCDIAVGLTVGDSDCFIHSYLREQLLSRMIDFTISK